MRMECVNFHTTSTNPTTPNWNTTGGGTCGTIEAHKGATRSSAEACGGAREITCRRSKNTKQTRRLDPKREG